MKIRLSWLFVLSLVMLCYTCKDDEDDGIIVVPPADRTEQQQIDNALLEAYLQSHYYNFDALQALANPTLDDIVITELASGQDVPSGHHLLMDDVVTGTTTYEDADYEFYYLIVKQGGSTEGPRFSDNVRVVYSGNDTEGEVFDSTIIPDELDLVGLVPGWSNVLPNFKVSPNPPVINGDGTVSYTDYGVGVMFLPSGLGYFSASPSGLDPYENLIFKFELYQFEENDHDEDGVPSYLEDIDNDGYVLDEDDNTDNDAFVDYIDVDDDGDGVLTINEDLEPDTDLLVDRDGDGDPTNDIGDGDPTNDDTDGDGIPNYLDTDDNGSKLDDEDGDGIPDYIDNN